MTLTALLNDLLYRPAIRSTLGVAFLCAAVDNRRDPDAFPHARTCSDLLRDNLQLYKQDLCAMVDVKCEI